MNIAERLIRREQEDIIEIGNVMDAFYSSDAGVILRAIINGQICKEGNSHYYEAKIPADRILGRIEGFQKVIDSIELAIKDKDDLTRPIPEEGQDAS
jgi:hypothetical protein